MRPVLVDNSERKLIVDTVVRGGWVGFWPFHLANPTYRVAYSEVRFGMTEVGYAASYSRAIFAYRDPGRTPHKSKASDKTYQNHMSTVKGGARVRETHHIVDLTRSSQLRQSSFKKSYSYLSCGK